MFGVAEREGFEPSVRLYTLHSLSRRAPSASRSSLRCGRNVSHSCMLCPPSSYVVGAPNRLIVDQRMAKDQNIEFRAECQGAFQNSRNPSGVNCALRTGKHSFAYSFSYAWKIASLRSQRQDQMSLRGVKSRVPWESNLGIRRSWLNGY